MAVRLTDALTLAALIASGSSDEKKQLLTNLDFAFATRHASHCCVPSLGRGFGGRHFLHGRIGPSSWQMGEMKK
jgi:hypothetical protein